MTDINIINTNHLNKLQRELLFQATAFRCGLFLFTIPRSHFDHWSRFLHHAWILVLYLICFKLYFWLAPLFQAHLPRFAPKNWCQSEQDFHPKTHLSYCTCTKKSLCSYCTYNSLFTHYSYIFVHYSYIFMHIHHWNRLNRSCLYLSLPISVIHTVPRPWSQQSQCIQQHLQLRWLQLLVARILVVGWWMGLLQQRNIHL